MFACLLIGLDGSPNADEALEQAVMLGRRFKSKLIVAHVKETSVLGRRTSDSGALLERAMERVRDAGLAVETILKHGDPDTELAALAPDVDTVLVGRRGRSARAEAIGKTVSSLIRIAERTVIVCASKPSPMNACAIAFDGRETAQRALALVARSHGRRMRWHRHSLATACSRTRSRSAPRCESTRRPSCRSLRPARTGRVFPPARCRRPAPRPRARCPGLRA